LNQPADVRLHVAGRDAPGFAGEQNALLAAIRNGGPELAVENFAMRFDQHSRIGHFVFVRAENVAEIFNLLDRFDRKRAARRAGFDGLQDRE
jgi:hypothetical protein